VDQSTFVYRFVREARLTAIWQGRARTCLGGEPGRTSQANARRSTTVDPVRCTQSVEQGEVEAVPDTRKAGPTVSPWTDVLPCAVDDTRDLGP
jgi:hypothetical protein